MTEINEEKKVVDKVEKKCDNSNCECEDACKEQCDKKEVLTEVTSVAKEEQKTGQKINVPDPDHLIKVASSSLYSCRKKMETMMMKMPKRQIVRTINAIFDLPMDGLPVKLKENAEKMMYAIGQRAMSDRFIIIQHHINEEIKKEREKQNKAKVNNTTKEGEQND